VRKKTVKFLFGLILGLTIALLSAVNTILIWVATGPRSLEQITPYLERALEQGGQGYKVDIAETWLVWDGWKHPVDIRISNVAVIDKDGRIFSTFPEISLGVNVLYILAGEILPTSLTISKPVINLVQNPDRSISFGSKMPEVVKEVEKQEAPATEGEAPAAISNVEDIAVPFVAVLSPLLMPSEDGGFRKLRLIKIQDADISIGSKKRGEFFKSSGTTIQFRRDKRGTIQTDISGDIHYGQYKTPLKAQLMLDKQKPTFDGTITFTQLMPGVLANMFSDSPHLKLLNFNVPLDGKATMVFEKNAGLQRLNFSMSGTKGTIGSEKLEGTLDINSMHAEGQISNNLKDFQINELSADIGGSLLKAEGLVTLDGADAAVRANASIENVSAANVRLFWPPSLAPLTREWVTTNITEGNVPKAEVGINIAFGDLKKPILPKEAVDANITLRSANITYLPDHPQVKNVNALIHVDGMALNAAIESAEYLKETKMSAGRVLIEDLNPDNPYIKVSLTANSTAPDIVHFLGLPRLDKAKRLNLVENEAKGIISGNADVGFHFFAPQDESGKSGNPDIDYRVSADMKGMSQNNFMNKFDLSNVDGGLAISNISLVFKGKGDVNGASVSDSMVKYLFDASADNKEGFDTFIEATASAPVASLPKFGYPIPPFLSGNLGVKASVKQSATAEISTANLDLVNAALDVGSLAWKKPAGEPATLSLTAEKKDGALTIPAFHMKGFNVDAAGSATLNKELSELQSVKLGKFRFGNSDLNSLFYEKIDGAYNINFEGVTADVSSFIEGDAASEPTFSFQHFPALQFKGNVKRLILGKDRFLDDIKGEADCNTTLCKFANISGATTDGKSFTLRILRNPKGLRQLAVNADNAGAFLKALNLLDSMNGGEMSITGNYDDTNADSVLTGRMLINKYVIKDAPVLAKLLTLASLTGIIDTLGGKGIQFDKFSAPFTLTKDVITLGDNTKTYGSAIGLTAEGTITFPRRTLDVQGTVVPSYTLNNVFDKVPLFGPILTGGDGGGIFAARYSIKGTGADPFVTVNPLSILTPGFLRGMFDILDSPKKSAPASSNKKETKG
jgi:hypothetical protein